MDPVMNAVSGPFVVRPGRVSASEGPALFATLSTDSIATLVTQFYLDVLSDPDLGPIFARTIEPGGWDRHLSLMIDFWTSIMLASGRYKGSPLAVHSRIPGLRPEHFVQWLEIFDATADMLFMTGPAESIKDKARRIGRTLSTNLFWGADGKQAVDL
jgi:hemoglobin